MLFVFLTQIFYGLCFTINDDEKPPVTVALPNDQVSIMKQMILDKFGDPVYVGFLIWEKMETLARKLTLLIIVSLPMLYEVRNLQNLIIFSILVKKNGLCKALEV